VINCRPIPDVTFWFDLKRLGGVYTSPEALCWLLLNFLPVLTFLVPVESHQKVTLASVNFLLFILVLTSSANKKDSQLGPMRNFYLYTLWLDFLTLGGAVGVVLTYSRSSPMTKGLKNALPVLAKVTFVPHSNAAESVGGNGTCNLNSRKFKSRALESPLSFARTIRMSCLVNF